MVLYKLYFRLIKVSIKSQLSYKRDFCIQFLVWSIYSIVPFLAINLIFVKFGLYNYKMQNQLMLLYGIFLVGYDTARMLGRGFDNFQKLIYRGDLDIYYIRPLPITYQVISNDIFLRRLAGVLQGIILLIISIKLINYQRLVALVLFIMLLIFFLFIMYLGFFILSSAIFFISIAPSNILSFFIETSKNFGYLPLDMINKPVVLLFKYIIPIYFIAYKPLVVFLSSADNFFISLIPAFIFSFSIFALSIVLFHFFSLKYKSTNN